MNLEKFPSNEMARKMMETITGNGFYDRSYIGKWIFQVMGQEIEAAIKYMEELPEQAFPQSATWGIGYQELKYGVPENAGMTLEERRKRLMVWKILSPMNPAFLEKQISLMIGHDRVAVIENNEEYTFRIEIMESDVTAAVYPDVRRFVRKVKPSHLSLLLVGRYRSENRVNIGYEAGLIMLSEFYPRNNLQWLLLDGTWNLNGDYTLSGYKAGALADFYPVYVTYASACGMDGIVENRLQVVGEYQEYLRAETVSTELLAETGINEKYSERFHSVSESRAEILSEGRLRVEVDLWHLDGTVALDGSRSLKSEIIEYFDEKL